MAEVGTASVQCPRCGETVRFRVHAKIKPWLVGHSSRTHVHIDIRPDAEDVVDHVLACPGRNPRGGPGLPLEAAG